MSQSLTRSQSGRFLAGMRVAMALLFGLWIWLNPSEAADEVPATIPLFEAYLIFAVSMLAIAYRSWWFEHRLASPTFVVDVATFVTGLAITEAVTLDFFSAFMTFFVFLMLSSAVRWNRHRALAVAGLLALCFLLAGLLVDWRGLEIDLPKFARRFGYLVMLSMMLIWFAATRTRAQAPRFVWKSAADRDDPLSKGLTYAVQAYGASGGAIAWLGEGERHPRLVRMGTVDTGETPARLDRVDGTDDPLLFDVKRGRQLTLDSQDRLSGGRTAQAHGMADAIGVGEGLSIPIVSRTGRGQLILAGIDGLCSDDLLPARAVAREIASAIDEEETEALLREVAMSRLRSQIAADLHDSVVQTLAGASFRLEALRGNPAASAVETEIGAINAAIAAEQTHVRAMIDKLRRGAVLPGARNLYQELAALADPLGEQWQVSIGLEEPAEPIIVSSAVTFEIQQILREAIANAARHGQARTIQIGLTAPEPGALTLTITDDGKGFPADGKIMPRSISERVSLLGGTMHLDSSPGMTGITIVIPIARAA